MNTRLSTPSTWVLAALLGLLYLASLGLLLYGNIQAGDSAPWQLITSAILLSIPLILLYACTGILVVAARRRAAGQPLEPRLAKWIYWSPRIAGILIIIFISLFALDVFTPGTPLSEMLLGFLIHMLPSIALTVVLILAWRWEWVGAFAFLAAGMFFMRFLLSNPGQGLGTFLIISAPLLVIALLFAANWRWHADLQRSLKPGPA